MNEISNNKRIAKNTLFLYFRVLVILAVNLYTIRVVLKTLGVVDYGIYDVVSGFVLSFTFVSRTSSTGMQRFLSYSLGRDDILAFNKYFENCYLLFILFSILSAIVLETLGLWFVYEKMVIPAERLDAALWVFQSSIIILFFSFFSIPYNSVIISYERMDLFAFVSIVDVVFKLIIVFFLQAIPYDHLKAYSVLYAFTGLLQFLLFRYLANRIHQGLRVIFHFNHEYLREIIGFTGWNFFGSISGLVRGQGLNILINIYFGPIYNAARSIAYQAYNAVNAFAGNFMTAVNPQIIKLYAQNQRNEWEKLVFRSSKLSFTLLAIVSYPMVVMMPYILDIWLGETPVITVLFTRLVMANMLIESVSFPLLTLAQATGKLKSYQLIVGGLLILNFPVSWVAFSLFNAEAYVCFIILFMFNLIALLFRLLILHKSAGLNIKSFFLDVFSRWLMLMLLCYSGYLLSYNLDFSLLFIVTLVITVAIIPLFSLFFIINAQERKLIFLYLRNRIRGV